MTLNLDQISYTFCHVFTNKCALPWYKNFLSNLKWLFLAVFCNFEKKQLVLASLLLSELCSKFIFFLVSKCSLLNSFWLDSKSNALPSVILYQGVFKVRKKQSKIPNIATFSNLEIWVWFSFSQKIFKKPVGHSKPWVKKVRKICH